MLQPFSEKEFMLRHGNRAFRVKYPRSDGARAALARSLAYCVLRNPLFVLLLRPFKAGGGGKREAYNSCRDEAIREGPTPRLCHPQPQCAASRLKSSPRLRRHLRPHRTAEYRQMNAHCEPNFDPMSTTATRPP